MKVYIGGDYGETPSVVATTIEQAMRETVMMHLVPSDDVSYDQAWTCEFIDGEPHTLRCTVTIDRHRLYVEAFDVEE
jgi:hypothetical protein